MSQRPTSKKRLLVALASYGSRNDRYLADVVSAYRSMPYDVDISVLSNISKQVAPGVEVAVGLPGKDPWSLPFAHKRIFAERVNNYDLFIYSEDDILIHERNIEAFLRVSQVLPEDEIAGFIRSETGVNGDTYYSEFHGSHHWDLQSVKSRDSYTFARFTNEHSGCFLLTQQQLRRAIESGGFLVEPHDGKYDLACTAATDPYTQCGFKKVICISHVEDFVVRHLSNRYAGTWLSLRESDFRTQISALLRSQCNAGGRPLFETQTRLKGLKYSKFYYEPSEDDVMCLIPDQARSVLSIGCGWGATEAGAAKTGRKVVAVPIDPVIGACAETRGVEVVYGSFEEARMALADRRFDCLFLSNVLHLVQNPAGLLCTFADLLSDQAIAIAVVPNLSRLPVLWRRGCGDKRFKDLVSYEKSGTQFTSGRVVRAWLTQAGFRTQRVLHRLPERAKAIHEVTFGLMDPLLAWEIVAVARKA